MLQLSNINSNRFTRADHLILNYLMRNEAVLYCETASDISKKVGVSLATIGRFWPKIGFDTFKDFKKAQMMESSTTPASKVKNTLSTLADSDSGSSSFLASNIELLADTLEKTVKLISPEAIENAARLITQKKKIYAFAPDASFGIAQVMKYRLRRFGIDLIFIEGGSALYESLNNIQPDDLILLFCFGRVLAETTVLLAHRQTVEFSCIIFSDLLANGLQNSEAFLYCYRGEPTEYHSMVSLMAVIDSLIIKIAMESFDSMARMNQLNDLRNKYQKYIRR